MSHWSNLVSQAECEAVANLNPTQAETDNAMEEDSIANGRKNVEIRADHIAKIAAEFLMDYS